MIPEGVFKATIKDHGIAFSSQKGTPEVFVEFAIDNETAFGDFWLTEGSIERAIEQLQLCGFTGTEFEDLNVQPGILIGNEVQVRIEHEDYTDDEGVEKTVARVAWVNDPNFQARKRAETCDATVSRFNALLATKQADGGGKAAGKDKDVPF